MNVPFDLNLLDCALLLVMLLFMLRGFFRGFIDEMAGLVGVIAGLWLAGRFYNDLGAMLLAYIKDPVWANMVSFAIILCLTLLAVTIVVSLFHRFVTFRLADWLNHLTGGFAGFAKGIVICAIMMGLMQTFIPDLPFMEKSVVRPHIINVSEPLMALLPI